MLNVDFEGISVRELADPSLHNWAHHVQHVLPQVSEPLYQKIWLNPDHPLVLNCYRFKS